MIASIPDSVLGLHQALLGHAYDPHRRDDEVIEHSDVEHCQGRLEGLRQHLIGAGRRWVTTGMVVGHHDGSGLMSERPDGKLVTTYYYNVGNAERFIGGTIWEP